MSQNTVDHPRNHFGAIDLTLCPLRVPANASSLHPQQLGSDRRTSGSVFDGYVIPAHTTRRWAGRSDPNQLHFPLIHLVLAYDPTTQNLPL